jgi:hypothetical protein
LIKKVWMTCYSGSEKIERNFEELAATFELIIKYSSKVNWY